MYNYNGSDHPVPPIKRSPSPLEREVVKLETLMGYYAESPQKLMEPALGIKGAVHALRSYGCPGTLLDDFERTADELYLEACLAAPLGQRLTTLRNSTWEHRSSPETRSGINQEIHTHHANLVQCAGQLGEQFSALVKDIHAFSEKMTPRDQQTFQAMLKECEHALGTIDATMEKLDRQAQNLSENRTR